MAAWMETQEFSFAHACWEVTYKAYLELEHFCTICGAWKCPGHKDPFEDSTPFENTLPDPFEKDIFA